MIEAVAKKATEMAEQKGQIETSALRDKILNELVKTSQKSQRLGVSSIKNTKPRSLKSVLPRDGDSRLTPNARRGSHP
jgi:hypothetical protein